MPKLTFLAPVFNKVSWIGESIVSLQNQTLKDIEIIFIDDGSWDGTADIIKFYMRDDKRIKLHQLKENLGLGKAWNIGTGLVDSPIICVASGDDIWVRERAEWTLNHFRNHPKNDVFYGAFAFCDAMMNPKEFKPAVPFSAKKLLTPRKDGFANQTIGHFIMAYKTKIGLKYPYDENRKYGVDYPFITTLIKNNCKFGWTSKLLGYARLLPSGVSVSHRAEIVKQDKEMERLLFQKDTK